MPVMGPQHYFRKNTAQHTLLLFCHHGGGLTSAMPRVYLPVVLLQSTWGASPAFGANPSSGNPSCTSELRAREHLPIVIREYHMHVHGTGQLYRVHRVPGCDNETHLVCMWLLCELCVRPTGLNQTCCAQGRFARSASMWNRCQHRLFPF